MIWYHAWMNHVNGKWQSPPCCNTQKSLQHFSRWSDISKSFSHDFNHSTKAILSFMNWARSDESSLHTHRICKKRYTLTTQTYWIEVNIPISSPTFGRQTETRTIDSDGHVKPSNSLNSPCIKTLILLRCIDSRDQWCSGIFHQKPGKIYSSVYVKLQEVTMQTSTLLYQWVLIMPWMEPSVEWLGDDIVSTSICYFSPVLRLSSGSMCQANTRKLENWFRRLFCTDP